MPRAALARHPSGGRTAAARAGILAAIPLLAMTAAGLAGGPAVAEPAVAEPGRPATVAVTQAPGGATDPACAGCGDLQGSALRLRLRPLLADGAGLIVRVFLDEPDADASSSTEDPAYAGSLVLSAAAGSTAQEFLLPLPRSPRSPGHGRATIVLVPIDRAGGAAGGVSVEGAALLGF